MVLLKSDESMDTWVNKNLVGLVIFWFEWVVDPTMADS